MSDEAVIEIQPHEQVLLIVVQRRNLDEQSTRELVDGVLTAAGRIPSLPIVLDFSKVRFAPSVALGALVRLSSSFKLDRRRIAMIGINQRLRETIRVTRLHTVLEIHDSLEQVTAQDRAKD